MLRTLDLFSGIGGVSLGLERTGGFRTVAFCENEPYPRAVLAKHWPEVPIYNDVRTLTATRLGADGISVDVICGGFPCQDISGAGKGEGIGGERSGLWHEMLRVIARIRPRWVIAENVAVLRSRGLDTVLRGLASIRYDAEWHIIPASAVGACHVRKRIWIIAYPRSARVEGPIMRGGVGEPGPRGWCGETDMQHWPAIGASRPDNDRWTAAAIRRTDDGLPNVVDRLHAIGNAVVPQIPEMIGRAILQSYQSAAI